MKKIIASVGNKGKNNIFDVKVVQGLLNQHKLVGLPIPLKIDGKSGPNSVKRIEAFQKNFYKNLGRKRPSFKTSSADRNVFLSDLTQSADLAHIF